MATRVRIRREAIVVSPAEVNRLNNLIDEHVHNQKLLAKAASDNKAIEVELDELLHKYGLKEYSADLGDAKYITPMSKASNVVDTAAFRDLVSDEDFLECVTVGITKARKVLSERELAAITETTKAHPKDPVLAIIPKP